MSQQQEVNWQKVALVGFGSQGKAWACNLRDSGRRVDIFLRNPKTREEELCDRGFRLADELSSYSVILLLIPDAQHLSFLKSNLNKIQAGCSIIYAHGASMMEHDLQDQFPQFNHLLLAPKAIASEVRFQYENKGKLGAVYSLEVINQSERALLLENLLSLAKDLGITAGPYPCSFAQEATADLFSEQSLLCGLLPHAAKSSFDLLTSRGISKELAYMECWLEVQLIANAMVKMGPSEFFKMISPHALKGSHLAKDRLFDKAYHKTLERLLTEIEDGTFFKTADELDTEEVEGFYHINWENSDLQKTHELLKNDLVP